MRKTLFFLFALLMTIGSKAETYTIFNQGVGTFYDYYGTRAADKMSWTSGSNSGKAGFVIKLTGSNVTLDKAANWALVVHSSAAETSYTMTLQAPENYKITGYELTAQIWSGSYPNSYVLTASDGTTVTINSTTLQTLSVSDLDASSTDISIVAAAASSTTQRWLTMKTLTLTLEPTFQAVNVTYNLYESDGTTLVSSVTAEQEVNSAVAIPTSLTNNYYDYTTEGTIGTTDCTIKVTRTLKSGIVYPIDNLSNNKAYRIEVPRGTYTTNDGKLANTAKSSSYAINTFALVSYEGNYYMWSIADSKFVAGNGNALTNVATPITFSASTVPAYQIKCGSNTLNATSGQATGATFDGWSAADDGNRCVIYEAADFDPTEVIARLQNYYPAVKEEVLPYIFANVDDIATSEPAPSIGKPFGISLEAATNIVSTYGSGLAAQTINADEYAAMVAAKDAGIIYPEAGKYYTIKSVSNGKYINVKAANGIYADADVPGIGSIVKATVRNEHTYFATQEKEFGWCYGASYAALLDAAGGGKYAHYSISAPGQVAFAHALGNGEGTYASYLPSSYYTVNANNQIVGGAATAAAAQWNFEEASSVNITLHEGETGEYWATMYTTFGVSLPTGTEAYVGKLNGSSLSLTSIGQNVPAGTPVILKGDAASITATINDEIAAISEDNDLQGQCLSADAASETNLSLGKKDGKVGFYQYDGILGANKAYVVLPAGTGSNGFTFSFADDDVTGISEIVDSESSNSKYFDLQGRKVAAPQKGQLYIKGGKIVKY